jgi:hypothetical protein
LWRLHRRPALGHASWRTAHAGALDIIWQVAVNVGQGGQDFEPVEQRSAMPVGLGFDTRPVDWRAVENGVCHIV